MRFNITDIQEEMDRSAFRSANEVLENLASRKRTQIVVEGPLEKSKLAWQISSLSEALLRRTIMLGEGIALCWNASNPLTTFLACRALVETCALLADLEERLLGFVSIENPTIQDIGKLYEVTMNRLFSSRDEDWVADYPQSAAINVLTFIDKLDKTFTGARKHYDRLSERCHPNSAGLHLLYATTEYETGTVHFDDNKGMAYVEVVGAAITLLPVMEFFFERIDKHTALIADIHHRLAPSPLLRQ
jgi:hypothetical protein